jgi:hypothetical protein
MLERIRSTVTAESGAAPVRRIATRASRRVAP